MKTKRPTREISGVLLLNKALGVSSNHALQQVKRLFQAAKAGHTGSLDPLASGVLPICLGEATKFSRFQLEADKSYKVTAKLGVTTTTSDAEGEILETKPVPKFSRQDIIQATSQFVGASKQIPSMYSALKHNGQPLYKLARQGLSIERPARDIFIYQYDLLEQTPDTLSFLVKCSKGTYIRNLIEDLGVKLGCGAHVIKLERVQAGPYTIENSYTIEQLQACDNLDALLLPTISAVEGWPHVVLSEAESVFIMQGRSVKCPEDLQLGWVSLISNNREFLGVGETLNDGCIHPRRLITKN
jgi:tRNA pseudouridine55 synthase